MLHCVLHCMLHCMRHCVLRSCDASHHPTHPLTRHPLTPHPHPHPPHTRTTTTSQAGYQPFVGSTKSLSGHALGAAGVHEAIYCMLMMQKGFLAESANINDLVRSLPLTLLYPQSRTLSPTRTRAEA